MAGDAQKYETYKIQISRLNKALKAEFYLEAVLIEYAILEDRLESALRHADAFVPDKQRGIQKKIMKLRKLCENKRGLARRYFSEDLLSKVTDWKDRRNPLVHELMVQNADDMRLKEFALEGKELVRTLDSKVACFKRALARETEKGAS